MFRRIRVKDIQRREGTFHRNGSLGYPPTFIDYAQPVRRKISTLWILRSRTIWLYCPYPGLHDRWDFRALGILISDRLPGVIQMLPF